MIKAVIFDLDGTLIDGAGDLHAAMNALLAEQSIAPISLAAVESFIGDGIGTLVARSYLHAGIAPEDLAARIERFKIIYGASGYPLTHLYPGVEVALRELRERYTLGVCTNKDEAYARAILVKCGIAGLFNTVVGGDTLPVRKPDPRMLLTTAAVCDATVSEIVYVGDSMADVELSKAVGSIFFLFKNHQMLQGELSGDANFSDYGQLPALVRAADEGNLR